MSLLTPHFIMVNKPRTPPPPLLTANRSFLRAASILLLPLLLLLLSPSSVLACSDPNDVNCQICPHSSRGNSISGFPRVTAAGHSTSSNLGHFTWLTCNDTGSDCQSYLSPLDPSYSPASDHSSPDNYVQSLLAYSTFALCCAVIAATACIVFLLMRCCTNRANGGGAGGRYPTAASTGRWSLGYGQNEKTGELQYSPAQRWSARAWMWLSVILLLVWVAVGWFEGGRHVQSNARAVITAPQPLVAQVQSTQPAVVTLLNGMAEDVLVATITNITAALDASVDLPALVTQLGAAQVALTSLPSVQPVQSTLLQLQASTAAISTTIATTLPNLTATLTTPTAILTPLITNLTTSLSRYNQLTTPLAITNLPQAQSYATQLSTWSNYLYNPATEAGYIEQVLQYLFQYHSIPTPPLLQPVIRSIQLVLSLSTGQPLNATESAALFQNVLQLYVTLEGLPQYQSASAQMSSVNNFINVSLNGNQINGTSTYLNVSDQLISQIIPLLSTIQSQYANLVPFLNVSLPISAAVQQLATMQAALSQLPTVAQLQTATTVLPALQSVITQLSSVLSPLNVLTTNFLSLPSSTLLLAYNTQLNSTVPPASYQLTQTLTQLQSLVTTTTTTTTPAADTAAIQQLANVTITLPLLSNASFINSLSKLNSTLSTLRLSQYIAPLSTLQNYYTTTITNVNSTIINAYYNLGVAIANILMNITRITSDLNTFTSGYCDNNNAALCNSYTPCAMGGNCIGISTKRCAAKPTVYCNYTTQCPPTDRCLIDGTIYDPLYASVAVAMGDSTHTECYQSISEFVSEYGECNSRCTIVEFYWSVVTGCWYGEY